MLKIKDNIDLKELEEKYGLTPRYNEYTGEIDCLEHKDNYPTRKLLKFKKKNIIFLKRWRDDYFVLFEIGKPRNENYYNDGYDFDFDLLYKLITDGIVERTDR